MTRHKKVTTLSGAEYLIYEDGKVERPASEDILISWTVDDHQYTEGFINEAAGQTYDNIRAGHRFLWMGVFGDFAEPIRSSLVQVITEVDDE